MLATFPLARLQAAGHALLPVGERSAGLVALARRGMGDGLKLKLQAAPAQSRVAALLNMAKQCAAAMTWPIIKQA